MTQEKQSNDEIKRQHVDQMYNHLKNQHPKKELIIQKNRIIKYFLFLNIAYYFALYFTGYSWLNEVIALSLIAFFVFSYLKSRKKSAGHVEYNINVIAKEKSFALFEVYAGTIIGQILILIIVFSFRLFFLSLWIKFLFLLPLVFIAVIFEEEYKKNKKFITLNKY